MKVAKFSALLLAGIMGLTSAAAVYAEGTITTDTEFSTESAGDSVEETTKAADTVPPMRQNLQLTPVEETTKAADRSSDAAPRWQRYNNLISRIKNTSDTIRREALMHRAEDILMETGALLPLYYYNDVYLQKEYVSGICSSVCGFQYFMFADNENGPALCVNLAGEPDTLDPALNSALDGGSFIVNVFEGLYTYSDNGRTVLALADSCIKSSDGLTYTFTLKDDLFWSDGTKLTADDFVYAWNRAAGLETETDCSGLFDCITRRDDGMLAVAADGDRLIVNLAAPCAYFPALCALPAYFPVLRSQTEAETDWEEEPGAWASKAGFVSNGAYTLESWEHGGRMVFVKNQNYYRADEVKIDRIELTFNTDREAVFEAYDAGDLDFVDTVLSDEIQNLSDSPELHIEERDGTCCLCFNVNSALFEGKTPKQANAVRRALSLLIDRNYIVESVVREENRPANTFIPAGMSDGNGGEFRTDDRSYTYPCEDADGYYDLSYEAYDENLEEAMSLLAENGFEFNDDGTLSEETPLNVTYLVRKGTIQEEIAKVIRQDFAVIGVNVIIDSQKQNVFSNRRKNGNFDMVQNSCRADFNDPVSLLEWWTTDSDRNYAQLGR